MVVFWETETMAKPFGNGFNIVQNKPPIDPVERIRKLFLDEQKGE